MIVSDVLLLVFLFNVSNWISIWNWTPLNHMYGHLMFNMNRNQNHIVLRLLEQYHLMIMKWVYWFYYLCSTFNKMVWCFKRFTWLIVHWNNNNLFQLISYQFWRNNNHWLNIWPTTRNQRSTINNNSYQILSLSFERARRRK